MSFYSFTYFNICKILILSKNYNVLGKETINFTTSFFIVVTSVDFKGRHKPQPQTLKRFVFAIHYLRVLHNGNNGFDNELYVFRNFCVLLLSCGTVREMSRFFNMLQRIQ